MTAIELVIFDCDGVLIDSEAMGATALAGAISDAGVPMTTQTAERTFSGAGRDETHALIAGLGLNATHVLTDAGARLEALFAQGVPPVPGMHRLLAALDVPVCVASNSGVDRLRASLGRTPLAAFFGPHIYSADHVAHSKPAPDLALHCLAQMHTAADCAVFIDDNIHGIRCARAAGVLAIGFVGPADHRANHADTLRAAGADHVVHGAEQLGSLLARLTQPSVAATV
ncbi:haloacid dehalogenase superfamily, subfamily IA, variant 3 with third motif having DD or ED [Pseudosulfitobacter pseudonitzschiae]|uniref:6-phosphogluconate phosphatase n=1 Tax=Pseudosulfitobacter pseudonitzschiae TaxID=1402135 RepID=A0A073IYH3_9RHOB|nr:HAD-IA family hydrolase [Pseudosulfitobacter pseudonitzschiae]KEJ95413.1 hypothetical protein SUH3_20715 [Pseudosulfitobacter pseudonitzschiae]QKS09989.1 HAD-IA family hydrolase [Pseudosulfitobacter pseudonitzschiae]SHE88686.1 haloacid dehalogenase superfamily, subfamily IA, variant 3 with third motif having DD or ED [Pseudosulfitobacter pseudonitzschiae]